MLFYFAKNTDMNTSRPNALVCKRSYVVERHTAVTAYFLSRQLPLLASALQCCEGTVTVNDCGG